MIVFDNITFSLQKVGGVSRFWSHLIAGFSSRDDVCFLEAESDIDNVYRKGMMLPRTISVSRYRSIWIYRYLDIDSKVALGRVDNCTVFHSSYYRLCTGGGISNITTVHDMIYEKFIHGPSRWVHTCQKRHALEASVCIVCVSENTKKDLLKYYPECKQKDVRVIPNGVSGFLNMVKHYDFNINGVNVFRESYFLYVGHRSGGAKAFDRVYTALSFLTNVKLVVVGDPFVTAEIKKMQSHGYCDRIINVGRVTDEYLNVLYSNAEFLFFPSIYEGFGIPPLEAMMAHCPVLASNRSSIPEVVGDAALLFDPDVESEIKDAIKAVTNASIRESLIAEGIKRASYFAWDFVIDQYNEVYREYGS